jgi:hypothetical protein
MDVSGFSRQSPAQLPIIAVASGKGSAVHRRGGQRNRRAAFTGLIDTRGQQMELSVTDAGDGARRSAGTADTVIAHRM